MLRRLGLWLLLGLLGCSGAPPQPPLVEAYVRAQQQGLEWVEQGRLDRALIAFADAQRMAWVRDDRAAWLSAGLNRASLELQLHHYVAAGDRFAQLRAQTNGDPTQRAQIELGLAQAKLGLAQWSAAEELLGPYHDHPDAALRTMALSGLGLIQLQRSDWAEAGALFHQALELAPAESDAAAVQHTNLGALALRQQDWGRAAEHLQQALRLARQQQRPSAIAVVLELQAELALAQADVTQAQALWHQAHTIYQHTGQTRAAQRLAQKLQTGAEEK